MRQYGTRNRLMDNNPPRGDIETRGAQVARKFPWLCYSWIPTVGLILLLIIIVLLRPDGRALNSATLSVVSTACWSTLIYRSIHAGKRFHGSFRTPLDFLCCSRYHGTLMIKIR
jgi:hypothetical protein